MFEVWKRCLPFAMLSVIVVLAGQPVPAQDCGEETDCEIGARTYLISLPADHVQGSMIGAMIFAHGFRGTAAQVMGNKGLKALASEIGVAFVAAQAAGPEWNIPHIPTVDARPGVDELAYFDDLVSDLTTRFNVDPSRIVVAGFSSGAMMVWHLACFRGTSFAGFVPMSGTFWTPIPTACPTGAVNLVHYHGGDDPVVPLHGRQIKDARQGDVFEALALFSRMDGYRRLDDDRPDGLECSRWMDGSNRRLELCLFDEQHELKLNNLSRAVRLFLVK
jgi:polyhydroxybutyrate depolymerase